MPGAQIAIDQDRPGPSTSFGTPGISRNDLWLGNIIRPRCSLSGNSTFAWTLLDKPRGSSAALTDADQLACAVLGDVPGTYRLQLVTNGGGPGNITIMTFRVRYDSVGALVRRGWALPAMGESPSESNYPTGFGDNDRGYDEPFWFIVEDVLPFVEALPFPQEICLLAGEQQSLLGGSGKTLFGRYLDLSAYPDEISGKTRQVTLSATLVSSVGTVVGQAILYNVTDSVAITGAAVSNSGSTTVAEYTSSALTVGSGAGELRDDAVKFYELRLVRTAGSDPDYIACLGARLTITYT